MQAAINTTSSASSLCRDSPRPGTCWLRFWCSGAADSLPFRPITTPRRPLRGAIWPQQSEVLRLASTLRRLPNTRKSRLDRHRRQIRHASRSSVGSPLRPRLRSLRTSRRRGRPPYASCAAGNGIKAGRNWPTGESRWPRSLPRPRTMSRSVCSMNRPTSTAISKHRLRSAVHYSKRCTQPGRATCL